MHIKISTESVLDDYVDFVSTKVGSIKGTKIALDPGNGVGCVIVEKLFQKLGAETHSILVI